MPSLAEEFQLGLQAMRAMGLRAQSFSDISALQSTTHNDARRLTESLSRDRAELERVRRKPGIAQYAKDVTGEAGADLNAAYQAMIDQSQVIFDTVDSSIPSSAAGWAEVTQPNADGTWTDRAFTSPQTGNIRAECDILVSLVPDWAYKQS